MEKKIVLVRTKIDTWDKNHKKTVEEELANDLQQAKVLYPACQRVIGVGKGKYDDIRPELSWSWFFHNILVDLQIPLNKHINQMKNQS